jgi:hypothetical protein
MSQSAFSIPNEVVASFRADMNAAFQALASQSAGASAPGTMYAYQRWADTTSGTMKRRNAANSAWVIDGPLAETFAVARSSNTILAAADHGKTFVATSSFTQTLTAAATLGDGWGVQYRNDGTGIITLDPNGSETIDGATTITLPPGAGVRIRCDGSNFKTVGRRIGTIPDFTSTEQTVPGPGNIQTVAHGLGTVPRLLYVVLRNKTTELNYSVGDEVICEGPIVSNSMIVISDATNVVIQSIATIQLLNKSTGVAAAITNANWKYVVRAWA